MTLFPFLFPHGHNAYDGKTHFNEYLKYRMSALFSPFTLYKPYLLYMYDLPQSLQLIKETSRICLDKDIKNYRTQNPKMSEKDILRWIVKYNLLANIPSTLQWHKAQLQDLLYMVKHSGMPHSFLTPIVDETSSFRWEEIIDIERIAKKIHTLLDWKHSLAECIILFHSKVDKFIQLLLSSHKTT